MLEKIQDDYYNGNYKEIIDSVIDIVHKENFTELPVNKQIMTYYYLAMSYTRSGQYDENHKIFQQAKERYNKYEFSLDFLPMYFPESLSLINQGQCEMSFSLLKDVINNCNLNIYTILEHPDDFNNYWPIIIFGIYSATLKNKGLLNESIKYVKVLEDLKFGEKILSKQDLAYMYHLGGNIYKEKGQLTTALEYYKKSLELTNDSNNVYIRAALFHFIGTIYYYLGNYQESVHFLTNGVKKFKAAPIVNTTLLQEGQFYLLRSYLDIDDYLNAELELESLKNNCDNTVATYYYKLGESLFLAKSTNIKTKLSAIPILEDLLKESDMGYDVLTIVVITLCELNFLLLKAFPDHSLLLDTIKIVNDHYDKAQSNNVYHIMTQMLYFKSKLFLLEENYNEAEKCLSESLLLAKEHGLDILQENIEQDLQKLKNEANRWYKAFEQNVSLSTRLDMLQIENYFKEVKKIIKL